MTIYLAERVKEGCSGTGLNNLVLTGAVSGFRTFADAIPVGGQVYYVIQDGLEWEVGLGTLASSTELTRDTIIDSSQTSDRVNTHEAGTPVKIALSDSSHVVGIAPVGIRSIFLDASGNLIDQSPFRAAIFVDTIAAMKALNGLLDNETVVVRNSATAGDGKGGVFYFDADDATSPDNVDTFRNDNYVTGLHKRVRIDVQGLVQSGSLEVDALSADATGGELKLFHRKKATAATAWSRWFAEYTSSTVAKFRMGIRHLQSSAEKFFMSGVSEGNNFDRVEVDEPLVMPTRTNANGLKTRAAAWLSGVSRFVFAQGDAAASGSAADYWEIPLTKGGYLCAVVNTVTALKAVDAAKFVVNGDVALLLGKSAQGDIQPTYFAWSSASTATADDATVIRPSVGTAAAGAGRWLIARVSPSATFANADSTPSIALGGFFVTTGTTAITDFDDAYEGQIFVVERGGSDIVITHNASLIDCGGANLTLTTTNPRAMFQHVGGVHKYVGGAGAIVDNTAYDATSWDGDTTHAPSKNAVRDKIEAMISDTAYDATSWDGVNTIAPSKNSVRDKIEALVTSITAKLDAVLTNGSWSKGRNAANNADKNMWRINSSDYLEPGTVIYYDNSGNFTARNANLLTARYDNLAPTTLHLLMHMLVIGKGDNTNYPRGVGCMYLDAIDDTSVDTDGERGLLYTFQATVSPKRARSNTPYDDCAAVIVQHNGTAKATEHIYIGVGALMSGASESTGAVGIEANADNAMYATGDFAVGGINFSRGLASPNHATFGAAGAIAVPSGAVCLTGRNAANSSYTELLKWTTGDVLEIMGKEVLAWANWTPTISSGTGTLTSATNVAGASRWSLMNNVVHFSLQVQVVTKGTGATSLICTLPVQAEKWTNFAGERTSTGTPLVAHVAAASSNLVITLAGGVDPLQDGAYYSVSGSYEVNY